MPKHSFVYSIIEEFVEVDKESLKKINKIKLKMKPNLNGVWPGHEQFHLKPKPGTLIIFPGYLEHEYAVDYGYEPFRFIHWNIQAVPKEMAKDVV